MQERAALPEINLKTEDLLNALCVLDGSIRSIGCHLSTMPASAKNFKLCPHCLNGLVTVCVSVNGVCVYHVHICLLCSLPGTQGSDS